MPTFITQIGEAAASIAADVGGYFEFLTIHFEAYATPRSVSEFLLLCITAVVLTQMVRVAQGLARVNQLPADVETEVERLRHQIGRLSRTLALLQAQQNTASNVVKSAEEKA